MQWLALVSGCGFALDLAALAAAASVIVVCMLRRSSVAAAWLLALSLFLRVLASGAIVSLTMTLMADPASFQAIMAGFQAVRLVAGMLFVVSLFLFRTPGEKLEQPS